MLIEIVKSSVIYGLEIKKLGDQFECDNAIAKSLIARGYAKEVGAVNEQPETGKLDPAQLEEMSYTDLKALAKDLDISTKGTKAELIARIAEVEVELGEELETVDENEEENEDFDELPNTSMPE